MIKTDPMAPRAAPTDPAINVHARQNGNKSNLVVHDYLWLMQKHSMEAIERNMNPPMIQPQTIMIGDRIMHTIVKGILSAQ